MLINPQKKIEMQEKHTKYEIARILGARSLQLAMNAPRLINLSEADLKEVNYDSLRIAEIEFYSGILPISIKRPFPQKKADKSKKSDITKKDLVKTVLEKEKAKKEKVAKNIRTEEKKAEGVIVESENLEKKEGSEVEEEAEIMELAKPEDELEEAGEPGVEGEAEA